MAKCAKCQGERFETVSHPQGGKIVTQAICLACGHTAVTEKPNPAAVADKNNFFEPAKKLEKKAT